MKRPVISIFCLSSSLHEREFVSGICGKVINLFKKYTGYGDIFVYDEPIEEPVELRDRSNPDILVLIHATGGTSSLAKDMALRNGGWILLVAHDKHNSLASALSARRKISEYIGYAVKGVRLVYFDNYGDLEKTIKSFMEAAKTIYRLKQSKIAVINEKGILGDEAAKFILEIGASLEAIDFEKLWKMGEEAGSEEVEEAIRNISKYIDLRNTYREYVDRIARIYIGMKKLVEEGYSGIIIDCFPLVVKYRVTPCIPVAVLNAEGIPVACEEDYHSFLLMYLAKELTGLSGWISNPSGVVDKKYLRFAHCTIAPNIGVECKATTHFETGYPYAVVCKSRFRDVLFGRVDQNYKLLVLYRGKVVDSGMLAQHYCRTQMIVEPLSIDPYRFMNEALGNHHVFIPLIDDILEKIKWAAWLLGINIIIE